jgi:hypothetical protein
MLPLDAQILLAYGTVWTAVTGIDTFGWQHFDSTPHLSRRTATDISLALVISPADSTGIMGARWERLLDVQTRSHCRIRELGRTSGKDLWASNRG